MAYPRTSRRLAVALLSALFAVDAPAAGETDGSRALSQLRPVALKAVPANVRTKIGSWVTTAKIGEQHFYVSERADKLLLIEHPSGASWSVPWKPARWMRDKMMASDGTGGQGWVAKHGKAPLLLLESGFAYSGHDHSVSWSNLHAFAGRGTRLAQSGRLVHLNWIPLQQVTISDDRDTKAVMCAEGAAEPSYIVRQKGNAFEIVRDTPKTYEFFTPPAKRGQPAGTALRALLGATRPRCTVRWTAACVIPMQTRYRLSRWSLRRQYRAPQPWITLRAAKRLLKLTLRRYERRPGRLKGRAHAEAFSRCFGLLTDLRPDLAAAHYHHASALARGHSPKLALTPLKKALSLSPDYAVKARKDEELASLRTLPEFRRLVGASKQRQR